MYKPRVVRDAVDLFDLEDLMFDALLGSGVFRDVYTYGPNNNYVIKVVRDYTCSSNIQEWNFWNGARNFPDLARWLAPCITCSPSGRFLIQHRVGPINPGQLPEKAPAIFTDLHNNNWGMFEGRPVVLDYNMTLDNEGWMNSNRRKMKVNAAWRDAKEAHKKHAPNKPFSQCSWLDLKED